MDSSHTLNGFPYSSLHEMTKASASMPTLPTWATLGGASGTGQEGQQVQAINFPANRQATEIESGLLSSSAPSLPSLSSSSASTPSIASANCHPLEYSSNIDSQNTMNIFEPTPVSYSMGITQTLSPYSMFQGAAMSRSSSTPSFPCINPTALMLNSSQESLVDSAYFSSPGTRRQSTFSLAESEDDPIHSMFSDSLRVSSPSQAMPPSTDSDNGLMQVPAYTPDLMLPDGTLYRFDGTSLVPAPSVNFSNLPHQSFEDSPMIEGQMPFPTAGFMDQTLPMPIPQYYMTEYGYGVFDPTMLTAPLQVDTKATPGAPTKRRSLRASTVAARRNSTDSVYSNASSSSASPSVSKSVLKGHSSNKYRKDGAGQFQCPFDGCTYRYNLRRELNRHRNVHVFAGKDKYRCMNCNSGLCRLDSVKRHMEAKGKAECLKKGLYQEFRENGELVRIRKCKPSWYEAAAANAASGKM